MSCTLSCKLQAATALRAFSDERTLSGNFGVLVRVEQCCSHADKVCYFALSYAKLGMQCGSEDLVYVRTRMNDFDAPTNVSFGLRGVLICYFGRYIEIFLYISRIIVDTPFKFHSMENRTTPNFQCYLECIECILKHSQSTNINTAGRQTQPHKLCTLTSANVCMLFSVCVLVRESFTQPIICATRVYYFSNATTHEFISSSIRDRVERTLDLSNPI